MSFVRSTRWRMTISTGRMHKVPTKLVHARRLVRAARYHRDHTEGDGRVHIDVEFLVDLVNSVRPWYRRKLIDD